ncbi:glycosyl hydrolase [Runella zeae]|uniref:glycosyl hydrolase n=1 Tax=Runella zeae TaxID=94255 RepID=UPI0004185549|nr:glycosyl hydrolase [Runella zeae]
MHLFSRFYFIVSYLLLISLTSSGQSHLKEIFLNPPQEARTRGYWIWGHGTFDYTRITEELEAFKKMGMAGVDIFDMGIADAQNVIPSGPAFMSDEMLDGIVFALQEAKRLGLSIGLSVSNGWNAGGDWTTYDEMSMHLLFRKDTLEGPQTITQLQFPSVPTSFKKPYGKYELFPEIDAQGFPKFYENVALFAYPLSSKGVISDPKKVIFFDPKQINNNTVNVKLPAGKWVLTRVVVTPLGQKMWMKSDNSNGYIMDHFSEKATKHHFEHIIQRLKTRLGPLNQTALERLYLCSFESEATTEWSPRLPETFFKLHGYRIEPYLPILAGQTMVDAQTSARFMHDYRVTISEMFINNHYRQARKICHENGLLLASESGGPGPPLHLVPTEDLKALGSVDIMRGEFWHKKAEYFDENGNDILQVVKNIASAAHIYGHKVVEMESFTSHLKHWQENPFELKRLADKAFCEGMTRVVYHTMPHSPKEAGVPGWSYQAGTHISPKMTWWNMSKPFHDYLARTSALLQQGTFVADVAYYYGEKMPNFASGSKYTRKTLGAGYDYDDLNKEVLLQSTVAEDGSLLLPSGMRYRLLVLPDHPHMSLEVLQKIEELLLKGATILGKKPLSVYGLKEVQSREKDLQDLAKKIWGTSEALQIRRYGKGQLAIGYSEKEILQQKGILPDVRFTSSTPTLMDYIHRTTTNEEIYFISNRDSLTTSLIADFRVHNKQPQLWSPVDGSIKTLAAFSQQNGRTQIPLQLAPGESVFIVFIGTIPASKPVVAIQKEGQTFFPSSETVSSETPVFTPDHKVAFSPWLAGNYKFIFNNGQSFDISQPAPLSISFDAPWEVRFPHGWGFEPLQTFNSLIDWTRHTHPELCIFSGTATYKNHFKLEKNTFLPHYTYILDLGQVGEVAKVYLNGVEVGVSVFPPHQLHIDPTILRIGKNHLVVEVANTWLNQLVGEAQKPLAQHRTRSNLVTSQSSPWAKTKPLPSGLIGPVKIIIQKKWLIP